MCRIAFPMTIPLIVLQNSVCGAFTLFLRVVIKCRLKFYIVYSLETFLKEIFVIEGIGEEASLTSWLLKFTPFMSEMINWGV